MDINTKFELISKLKYRKERDGYIVLSENLEEYFFVNETGLILLEFLEVKRSLLELINELSRRFKYCDADEIGQDMLRFLNELIKLCIVRSVSDERAADY